MVTTLPLGPFLPIRLIDLADDFAECFVCREVMLVRRIHIQGSS